MKNYKIKTTNRHYSKISADTLKEDSTQRDTFKESNGELTSEIPRINIAKYSSVQNYVTIPDQKNQANDGENNDLLNRIRTLTQIAKSRVANSKESIIFNEKNPMGTFLTNVNIVENQVQKENVSQNRQNSHILDDPEEITNELKQFLNTDV